MLRVVPDSYLRGFCVARSFEMGNAKALGEGTGKGKIPTLLHFIICSVWEYGTNKNRSIMRLSKIFIIAAALSLAAPVPAEAQILGKWKKKAEETIKKGKDKIEKETGIKGIPGISKGNKTSQQGGVGRSVGDKVTDDATSGASYKKSDDKGSTTWRESSAMPSAEDLETPEGFGMLHASTFGEPFFYLRKAYHTPRETSSTVHLVLDDDMPNFSDFYDGVAYVNTYPGKSQSFYINERGEKLFDSRTHISDAKAMPRFYNGRVLEKTDPKEQKVLIRDKQGNIIKEFNTIFASPYFVNGVAAIGFDNGFGKGKTIKYIDTNGNFILDNISISAPSSSSMSLVAAMDNLVREEKDGLIAFPAWNETAGAFLWGFRDATGRVVIKPKYHGVRDFSDGMAAFVMIGNGYDNNKWGFIDKTGREVIPASFSKMPSDFDSGLARVVSRNEDAYLIDKTGKKVKGPYSYHANDGQESYISPLFKGNALIEYNLEGQPNYFYLVDRFFNKKAWFRIPVNISFDTPIGFVDDKLYLKTNTGGRDVFMLNPNNFDLEMDALYNPFINGYSRYSDGYIDDNFNYVIKFEKNEF